MSDIPADPAERLDFRAVLARIDRNQAETREFAAEREKLTAEAARLNRERFLAPALALAATLGAIAALAPSLPRAVGH